MTLNIKKYFLSFLGAILIFLITLFIYMMVMTAESIEIFFSNQITSIIIVFMVYSIIIFLLSKIYNDGILHNTYRKLSISSLFKYDKKYVVLTLLCLFISILYCYLSGEVLELILHQINEPDLKLRMIFYLGAIVYAPIIEELIFRGIFFNIASTWLDMDDKIVKAIVIIINIIMFLSIHYIDYNFSKFNFLLSLLVSIIPKIFVSVSLTYIYFKTKDIKYNCILHIIYNFLILSISYILTSGI